MDHPSSKTHLSYVVERQPGREYRVKNILTNHEKDSNNKPGAESNDYFSIGSITLESSKTVVREISVCHSVTMEDNIGRVSQGQLKQVSTLQCVDSVW